MLVHKYILWFMLYSIVGWIYETILCSVQEKRFVNRGFLNGPYCSIYGVGALFDILLLSWIVSPVALFFMGAFINCTIEYVTSWLLEKLFHARWWDYSGEKFNINGRVFLLGAIIFGLFAVLLIKFIHPFVSMQTDKIPDEVLAWAALVMSTMFLFDVMYTVTRLSNLSSKLKAVQDFISNTIGSSQERFIVAKMEIEDKLDFKHIKLNLDELVRKFNKQEKRTIKVFPKFKSTVYKDSVANIREQLRSLSHKKKNDKSNKDQ